MKTVLITAGPTREALDPVRYITNHSTGKMGYAIACQFLERNYKVIFVCGPLQIDIEEHRYLKIIHVNSAEQMLSTCEEYFSSVDICVFAAAVADYRPAVISTQKIKKEGDEMTITLVKNPDIASCFGKIKRKEQLSVGFALETNDEMNHALKKMERKNLDLVVLNSMNDKNATFGFDTNKITIVEQTGETHLFPLKSKIEAAGDIVSCVEKAIISREKKYEQLAY